ncbi:MAG: 50S ribosomal protein L7/L12 [Patescibacteria group bacterium]
MAEEEKTEKQEIELSEEAQQVLEIIQEMSLLELNNLVKAIKQEFDIEPMVTATAAPESNGGREEEDTEEKSAYDVSLEDAGDQKIAVIKALRGFNQDLGLKEAKEMAESAPTVVGEGVPAEEAEELKKSLEEAGATAELK